MKKRIITFVICFLMLLQPVTMFALPAGVGELDANLMDGKFYWTGYPGADRYEIYAQNQYNGDNFNHAYTLSDSPIDLAEALKDEPAGDYNVHLIAMKTRSSGYETIAISDHFMYHNDTEYLCLPAPELKWEGTVLRIKPFDLTPYRKYGLTDNNFVATVTFYENGESLGSEKSLAYKFEFDLRALMDYSDRKFQVRVRLGCSNTWVKIGRSPAVMSEEVLVADLLNGYVTPDPIEGEVTLAPENYAVTPGNYIVASFASVNAAAGVRNLTWQYASASDSSYWKDIGSDRTGRFFLTDDLIGKYVRCKVTADGFSGYLVSNALRVFKRAQSGDPVAPELELSGGRIIVTNAKERQEYYVSDERMTVTSLENHWKDARSPSYDGRMTLNGTGDTINYVYTRLKETAGYAPGTRVAVSAIYLGEAELTLEVDGTSYFFEGEDGEYYTLAKNAAIKVTVSSPTYGSSFAGVYGYDWKVLNKNDSNYNTIYSDYACTKPIDSYERYKTVYFKHDKTENHIRIEARYNGQTAVEYLNVGNTDYIVPDSVKVYDITVPAGSDTGGFRVISDPQGVKDAYYLDPMNTLSFILKSGSGTAPVISNSFKNDMGFDLYDGTLHVDATRATPGVYVFEAVFTKGSADVSTGSFRVTVTASGAGVEEIKVTPNSATLSADGSLKLTATLLPAGASGSVTWESGNIAVAYVTEDGVVTASEHAKDGDRIAITARCGNLSAVCSILISANPFSDVSAGAYYYEPVLWAYRNTPQITAGVDKTRFAPDSTCTRAQIVTFLWRAKGCPEPKKTDNPFVDVKPGDYFYKAVIWAVESGVTNGVDATQFSPNAGCTRAQVGTFLWRTEGKPSPASGENPFVDVKGDYYYDAVLWAVEKKITNGTSKDKFSPNVTCTRGQIVTFLFRDMVK